ncbi:hypothetical protein B0H19DRAFT_1294201 [Mycena capillaripes]|nr:hypothetical protein B0H19DRAFT_1294201 [Mycena capillaripes]
MVHTLSFLNARDLIVGLDYVDELPQEDPPVNDTPVGGDVNQRSKTPIQAEESEIKRVFHPHSKRPPKFESFQDYVGNAQQTEPADSQPWRPFRSQLDFEVAEFCETNMLNKNATETLISLIQRCNSSPKDFTIVNQRELDELWELASHKCTAFENGSITIQYKNEDKSYDTYVRPLWDWARGLIQDPRLASSFVWDAEKAYKFNGDNHPAAKPVCYVIYADKSKLSTFGTQKAYAVVARLANIKIGIRNSTQFGGGQVVGHQPIVKDDPKENGKTAFSNFKNVVWHTALYKLLESLVHPSNVGSWTECGDGQLRWLWPVILILAADYEEACVMSLIRGLQGYYPCPMCFVPYDAQSDLSSEYPLRTAEDSEQIITEARALRTAAEREEMLKGRGLRNVDNVFWKIKGADPHSAISYDPLHADDGGFWGDHLFAQIKERVTAREAIVKIDAQMAAFPRWRNLNHFETVMNTSFNDGSKHEDIAKMMLFVAHNVLDVDEAGLLLLQVLRSYLELRTSISFEVHTSETIAEGRREIQTLDSTLKLFIAASNAELGENDPKKNWNFPKVHLRKHFHRDVEEKGASRNFGTKTSESMHGPIRNTYHRMTNFKDVTPQLVKHDHRRTVATFIREQIEALNVAPTESPDEDSDESHEDVEPDLVSNVDIGSKLQPISFSTLEQEMSTDHAFERFRVKLGDFISDSLPAWGHALPNARRVKFTGTQTIVPFQFLKVYYDSLSDWKPTVDYLRCNPKFHGHPRYDYVLVKTTDKPIFAQLIYLFSCAVGDKSYPLALILPLDAPIGRVTRKDKLLRFRRVRAKPRRQAEFISVRSIIRGAVLVADFDKLGDFLVFDVLDGDTSLRLKGL